MPFYVSRWSELGTKNEGSNSLIPACNLGDF